MTPSRGIIHRLSALALLATCMAAVWFGAIAPLVDRYGLKQQAVRDGRLLLARYKTVADYSQQVANFVASTEAQYDAAAYLKGPSETIAMANLQSQLKSIAASNGASFRSASSLPGKEVDNLKLAGVQIAISGPMSSIHKTIHTIETGKPFLFVLRAQLVPSRQNAGSRQRSELELNAQLDVYGALVSAENPE